MRFGEHLRNFVIQFRLSNCWLSDELLAWRVLLQSISGRCRLWRPSCIASWGGADSGGDSSSISAGPSARFQSNPVSPKPAQAAHPGPTNISDELFVESSLKFLVGSWLRRAAANACVCVRYKTQFLVKQFLRSKSQGHLHVAIEEDDVKTHQELDADLASALEADEWILVNSSSDGESGSDSD